MGFRGEKDSNSKFENFGFQMSAKNENRRTKEPAGCPSFLRIKRRYKGRVRYAEVGSQVCVWDTLRMRRGLRQGMDSDWVGAAGAWFCGGAIWIVSGEARR